MKRAIAQGTNFFESKRMKVDDVLEHDYINYFFIPSLENMAAIRIATELCKQPDIKDALRLHSLEFDYQLQDDNSVSSRRDTDWIKNFHEIEKEVLNKLYLLPLPKQLKANVSNIIGPILCQILEWMRGHFPDVVYIDSICWTSRGTIDKVKTLKLLIDKDSGEHTSHIFWLACQYCLEESIPYLWEKLSEEKREHFLHNNRVYRHYSYHLTAYWINNVNNTLSGLLGKLKRHDHKNIYETNESIYKNMFSLALSQGSSLAVKYFWNKLTDVEVYNNLEQWINRAAEEKKASGDTLKYTNEYTDIVFFLLSKVRDQEKQRELLQQNIDVTLNSLFVDWPWKMCLLPTIPKLWEFIDVKVYLNLLSLTVKKSRGEKDTKMLLRSFLYHSPLNFRERCIQRILYPRETTLLLSLLTVGDVETVKVLLNYANIEERKWIIFSISENKSILEVIYKDKFSVFGDMLIEMLSESDINRIKTMMVFKYELDLCQYLLGHDAWDVLKKFLSWAFTSQDQVDKFKKRVISIMDFMDLLFKDKYESVDKFLNWCCGSEQEIKLFKKRLAEHNGYILYSRFKKWCLYEKFVNWCFASVQEIEEFKSFHLRKRMKCAIHIAIADKKDIEFADQFISYCCQSNEEVKRYKEEFVRSSEWMDMLDHFRTCVCFADCRDQRDNWEFIKKLIKLFSPLSSDAITELKEKITRRINFDESRPYYYFTIKKQHLFRLLDNKDYDINGNDDTDNDKTSNDCVEDQEIIQVLDDILSEVEKI